MRSIPFIYGTDSVSVILLVYRGELNLDSTDPLVAALSDFQDSLSVEQKAKLLAIDSAPDALAVLQFTAEIDSSNARRKSRCVASRLQNTLQSVQQFTTVVDTFVSSNPSVAAPIWGTFKVTILVSYRSTCGCLDRRQPLWLDPTYWVPTSTQLISPV